jgi:hypothetical protein
MAKMGSKKGLKTKREKIREGQKVRLRGKKARQPLKKQSQNPAQPRQQGRARIANCQAS